MQSLWEFAQTLKHIEERTMYGASLEELVIQWDAAFRKPSLPNYPPELARAELYVAEAMLGVPEERRQK